MAEIVVYRMIDAQEVETVYVDSLFKEEELGEGRAVPEGAIVIELIHTHHFHPERLESHREEIVEWLGQLHDNFKQSDGGGWSFLQACDTKDGEQWTDFHMRMEQLFALGMGIDMVDIQMPREMWNILPGGMPYLVVKL